MPRAGASSLRGARGRLLSFLTLCLVGWCFCACAAPVCAPPDKLTAATVRYVIDGDTVVLMNGRHVRLIGINTMELGHHGAADEPYARAARRALREVLSASGGQVQLAVGHERKDHYGRTLASLFVAKQRDVGAMLIRRGLAAAVAIPPNTRRTVCYFGAESQARAARRGIWSPRSPLVHAADTLARGARGFYILTGRVTSARRLGGGMRLTLGQRLWLWVGPKNLHYFRASLNSYLGRRVLVRGWIHGYAGHAEMLLPYPADLAGY